MGKRVRMGDLKLSQPSTHPTQPVSTPPLSGTQRGRIPEYDYDGNGRNDINRFSLTARRVYHFFLFSL